MEVDVYGDLDDFNNQYGTVQQENEELKETIEKLEQTSLKFSIEISELRRVNCRLENNISSLYKTAKAELERKNNQIAELRKALDDMYFKRGLKNKGPPPKKNDTQDDQVLNKQFEKAQHDLLQKNRIIQNLNTELENVRKELKEKKRSLADDDYENNSFNKKRKLEKETFVENEKDYRNYRDRFERRNNSHLKSSYNYDSRGHPNNDLRSRIELKRLRYHRSRSRSSQNKNYHGSRRNSHRERSSDATDDSHEHGRNFRYNLNRNERSSSFFSRHTPERTYTPDSERQYSSREEIRSSPIENYRTESRKNRTSRSHSRGRYLEDRREPIVYDQNFKNNRVDNEILSYATEKIDCDSGVFNSQITESTCTPEIEPQYSPIISPCEEEELDSTNLSINLEEGKPDKINLNDLKPKETEQKISKLLDTSEVNKEITNETCIKIENVKPQDSSNLKVKPEEIQSNVEKTINFVVEFFSQEVSDSVVDESSKIVSKTINSKTDDVKLKSDISENNELVPSKSKVSVKSEVTHCKLKSNEETVKNKTKSNKENDKNKLKSEKETVKDKSNSVNETGKSKSKSEKETGKSKSKTEKETAKTKSKFEKETLKSEDKKSDSNKSSKSTSRTKSEKSCNDKSKIKNVKLKSEIKAIKSEEDKDVKKTEVNNSEISNVKSHVINKTNMSYLETKSNTQPCLTNETEIPFLETNSNTQAKSELNFLRSETKTKLHTYLVNETNMPILEIKSNIQTKSELNFLESKIKTTESNDERNEKTKVVENKVINIRKDKRDSNISLVIESNRNNSYKEITNIPSPVSNIQLVSELSKTQPQKIKKRFEFEKEKIVTEETKSDKNTPESIRKDNENDVSTNSIINNSEMNASEIKNSQQSTSDSNSQCSSSTTVSNTSVSSQPPNRGRRRRCVISIT